MATIPGSSGNDTLNGSAEADLIDGLAGADLLFGNGGNDTVFGGDGNDNVILGSGDDSASGGAGNDRITVTDGGNDTADGGADYDSVVFQFNTGVGFAFTSSGFGPATRTQTDTVTGGIKTLSNFEEVQIFGGSGNDTLTGDGGRNYIGGHEGSDILTGGGGFDTFAFNLIFANQGVDRIVDLGFGDDLHFNNSNVPGFALQNTILAGDVASGLAKGQVMVGTPSGGVTRLYIGTDDAAGSDITVELQGAYAASHFLVQNSSFGANLRYEPPIVQAGGPGSDNLNGGNSNDSLSGLAGNDNLHGNGGNDTLLGGDDNDFMQGGDGNDSIDGSNGTGDMAAYFNAGTAVQVNLTTNVLAGGAAGDTLVAIENVGGSNFNDTLIGNALSNYFDGSGGNDSIQGLDGNDNLRGASGDDTVDGGAGDDQADYFDATSSVTVSLMTNTAVGGGGTDTLISIENIGGSSFDDSLVGGTTRNSLQGNGGNDTLLGGDGDDYMDGGAGNDLIDGGNGTGDMAGYFSSTTAVQISLDTNLLGGGAAGDTLLNIENLGGSNFADALTGNAANNYLDGGDGDDTLQGMGGSDNFHGGNGNDSIDGGAGDDNIQFFAAASGVTVDLTAGTTSGGAGNDNLVSIENVFGSQSDDSITGSAVRNSLGGADGNDTLRGGDGDDFFMGGSGADIIDGGNGISDMAGYSDAVSAVFATLVTGGVSGGGGNDTLIDIENLGGSAYNDTLIGNGVNNFLDGGLGDDSIEGGDGADNLSGGQGSDALNGGNGNDNASYGNATAGVMVNLVGGTSSGGDGADTLTSIESVSGSQYGDTLIGSAVNNSLSGNGGNDFLDGGDGNDYLGLGDGIDTAIGGNGNDFFDVGGYFQGGNDSVDGGAGSDTVRFSYLAAAPVNFTSSGSGPATRTQIDPLSGATKTLTGIEELQVLGGLGNDTLTGDAGVNYFEGNGGNDSLFGGGGRDNFVGGLGNDTIDGGVILDRVDYTDLNGISYATSTGAVNVNLQTGTASDGMGGTDSIANIDSVVGSAYNDVITGSTTFNMFEIFNGGLGDDTIDGGAVDPISQSNTNRASYANFTGAVTVNLSTGTATGAGGNDTLINIQHAQGGSGHDSLTGSDSAFSEDLEGNAGNDTLDGMGGGTDTVRYGGATTGVTVNLITGVASDGFGTTDTLLNIEGVRGSSFNDTLIGGNPANGTGVIDGFEQFLGGAGNDSIDGGGGFDRVFYNNSTSGITLTLGGTGAGTAQDGLGGTDTLVSIEAVRGSAFNDTLMGSDSGQFESFDGRQGNDSIDGKGGIDRIDFNGDLAAVTVNLTTGIAKDGSGGTDTFINIENARGSNYNDSITGNAGANRLDGILGNDTLNGGAGADSMLGGAGDDTYHVDNAGDLITELLDGGTDTALTGVNMTLTDNLENATLTGAGLTLTGNALANKLVGTGANNTLAGLDGNDVLSGGKGNDTLAGGGGDDTMDGGEGVDNMAGGAGDDEYSIENAGDVVTELAGEGTDSIKTNLTTYTLAGTLENLFLTGSGNTRGTGNDLNNGMEGSSGNNTLIGGKGDDTLNGGAGDDSLDGGTGADKLVGGAGNDTYNYGTLDRIEEAANGGIDTVNSAININLGATLENVTLVGTTATIANGNALGNVINGNALANALKGGAGDDTMNGGAGDDVIFGGKNRDALTGGTGNDTFSFEGLADSTVAAPDLITDLQAGDKLDFSLIDANPVLAGNQAFTQVAAFTGAAGELTLTYNAAANQTTVSLNATADMVADMAVLLTGQVTSTAGWVL